jgi:hypothetical protein
MLSFSSNAASRRAGFVYPKADAVSFECAFFGPVHGAVRGLARSALLAVARESPRDRLEQLLDDPPALDYVKRTGAQHLREAVIGGDSVLLDDVEQVAVQSADYCVVRVILLAFEVEDLVQPLRRRAQRLLPFQDSYAENAGAAVNAEHRAKALHVRGHAGKGSDEAAP